MILCLIKRYPDIARDSLKQVCSKTLFTQRLPFSFVKSNKRDSEFFSQLQNLRVFAVQILEYFNLTKFFHTVYGSELNGRFSDKGELIAHIIEFENLDPKESLIVGDRVYDIIGGKKNGIMTASVSYGYGTHKEIASSKPDIIFDAFSELLPFLKIEASPNKNINRCASGPR